ncbi:MAG TPA: hypothetical protein VLI41_12655 [Phenylobacterium sp.]|uniref:hypothetical protein n=1 Tax=Phenylobacterium sp. TaxID=1871053 RepID=UPI002C6FDB0A|nr:hypothetical protein [Phenylobacterium sp.]HSV04046.1 hypothetical protein [Phenylobacterium sp.]
MFELGWDFLRKLSPERLRLKADGLTGGDAALLELLDLKLLAMEAKAADVAAGRVGARDRPQRRLEAAAVWREIARRTGEAATLRKAAAAAEAAAAGFEAARRTEAWARARCEQGVCAMLGAEIFGDPGLDAAAEAAFREARAAAHGGLAAPLADLGLAVITARRDLARADAAHARASAEALAAPIAALDAISRRVSIGRALAAEGRLIRADLLCGWGVRLKDEALLKAALEDAAAAALRVDPAYEPITWARAEGLRGQALTLLGELTGDMDLVAAGASALAAALDQLSRDHSPLDWARTQIALGQTLRALGDASAEARAYEQAVTCYERAGLVLNALQASPLRGLAAGARAACLAKQAELTGDLALLDIAEAAMKTELAALSPRRDPIGWALAQLHLARLYEARMDITGRDRGLRAAALTALEAALDVFAEQGMGSLSAIAAEALQRMRLGVPSPSRPAD